MLLPCWLCTRGTEVLVSCFMLGSTSSLPLPLLPQPQPWSRTGSDATAAQRSGLLRSCVCTILRGRVSFPVTEYLCCCLAHVPVHRRRRLWQCGCCKFYAAQGTVDALRSGKRLTDDCDKGQEQVLEQAPPATNSGLAGNMLKRLGGTLAAPLNSGCCAGREDHESHLWEKNPGAVGMECRVLLGDVPGPTHPLWCCH